MQVNPPNQFSKSKQDLPFKNPYFLLIQIFHLNYLKNFQKKNGSDYIEKPNYQNILNIENEFFFPS
jgi:hypothetical protein